MRVCGVDCGTETTGYGVVECDDRSQDLSRAPRLLSLDAGGICPPRKTPLPDRLAYIYGQLTALLERYRPDVVAVEEVFYSVNARTAIKLGHVRGVVLLAAATAGIPVAEYAPLSIKATVTGYGLAAKQQVQFMVARLLTLAQPPESADAADALAIAICHIHHAQTLSLQEARVV
ncbi:MAG: crossover junction endodeoxyribonuclease RuvC [Acidobacteriaceae bacterium]